MSDFDFGAYELEVLLGHLGYPGFHYLALHEEPLRFDVTQFIQYVLALREYRPRVAEGLPWVAHHYALEIDWPQLLGTAKAARYVNRLGYLLNMALLAAERDREARECDVLRIAMKATLRERETSERTFYCDDHLSIMRKLSSVTGRDPEEERWRIFGGPRFVHIERS